MLKNGWGLVNILKSARALYVAREAGAQHGRGKRDIERVITQKPSVIRFLRS